VEAYTFSSLQMTLEALSARLQVLEQEILRLTQLAAEEEETEQQDNFWRLALDVQREARVIRSQIARLIELEGASKSSPVADDTSLTSSPKRSSARTSSAKIQIARSRPMQQSARSQNLCA
jgi:hypothetical protein